MSVTVWDVDRFAADRAYIRDTLRTYVDTYGPVDEGRPFRAFRHTVEAQLDLTLSEPTAAECVHLQAALAAVDTDGIPGMDHRHPEYDSCKEALRFAIADSLDAAIRRLIGDHYLVWSTK